MISVIVYFYLLTGYGLLLCCLLKETLSDLLASSLRHLPTTYYQADIPNLWSDLNDLTSLILFYPVQNMAPTTKNNPPDEWLGRSCPHGLSTSWKRMMGNVWNGHMQWSLSSHGSALGLHLWPIWPSWLHLWTTSLLSVGPKQTFCMLIIKWALYTSEQKLCIEKEDPLTLWNYSKERHNGAVLSSKFSFYRRH